MGWRCMGWPQPTVLCKTQETRPTTKQLRQTRGRPIKHLFLGWATGSPVVAFSLPARRRLLADMGTEKHRSCWLPVSRGWAGPCCFSNEHLDHYFNTHCQGVNLPGSQPSLGMGQAQEAERTCMVGWVAEGTVQNLPVQPAADSGVRLSITVSAHRRRPGVRSSIRRSAALADTSPPPWEEGGAVRHVSAACLFSLRTGGNDARGDISQ